MDDRKVIERAIKQLETIALDLEAADGLTIVEYQAKEIRKVKEILQPLVTGHGTGKDD